MRIAVTHSTVYRYSGPVYQEPHTFRLRPRQDAAQRLLAFALDISPAPAGQTECLDQDGNVVCETWFSEPAGELAVHVSFEVETLRENPFDFILRTPDQLPLALGAPLAAALAPYLSTPEAEAAAFAGELSAQSGHAALRFLSELNRALFEQFGHEVRDEGPPHAAALTLRDRKGTCRDLAVLFCEACRAAGIPARFVSGYASGAAHSERADLHAWAEVYLPGGGWRGYDPSQGLAVATSHVAVAAAALPALAAPIAGTYRGSARATMDFSISLQAR